MTARRHLVLIGMMGSGKSAVGRECARRLARPFLDTDEMVEAAEGRGVSEIFAADGEEAFRALEAAALAQACASPQPAVIACGGGAVLAPANRELLGRHGVVVWLTAPPEVLARRVGPGSGRPLLAGASPAVVLQRLAGERADAYAEAADVVVDTAGLDVHEVAAAVLSEYPS